MSPTIPAFILPLRPPNLPVFQTFVYKTVGDITIPVDVYVPPTLEAVPHPVMLFIHGGGWMGSNRSDYCRPIFHEFLSHNFVVVSMDYRLLPETRFAGMLEDVRDIEPWTRQSLPLHLQSKNIAVHSEKIVVVGASAGAHLALLVPKLWKSLPVSILSMYGPTNMHQLPYLHLGRLASLTIPPCSAELLFEATNFDNPPVEVAIPRTAADYSRPRGLMSMHIFRESIITEFLLCGLQHESNGELKLPEKGCLLKEDVDEISPLHLCRNIEYPPIFQVMGDSDEIFEISHVHQFHDALRDTGVECEKVVVKGMGHAFDMWAEINGDIHREIVQPAVEWVARFASSQSK